MHPTPPAAIPRDHPCLRRLVPLTPLRHFYHLLRDFGSASYHREAARECDRRPDLLQELVAASVAHFGLYDNRGEGFHGRLCVGALSPEVLASPRPVHRILPEVARDGIVVPSRPDLDATYIDYEVSPIRTTGSEFESGVPCRAKGGIDVLLANARDRLPVVAEAKGATDRNLFLELIQALTYAVELSTSPQRERLARTYPGRFAWPPAGPALDVYLLLVGEPRSRHHPAFLALVDGICRRLLAPGTAVAGLVRQVACLEAAPAGGSFAVAFLHPAAP